jgi:YfiH family protein
MDDPGNLPRSGNAHTENMTLGLTSQLLRRAGFRHAFFMRSGGVSAEPWASLNFSTASGDSTQAVAENLERAAGGLGIEAERIFYLSQVHGVENVVLEGGEDREQVLYQRGDITLSKQIGVGCGVRMADCAPVLIGDARSGAVAAIHSGWRGTVLGAAAAGVAALRELIGGEGELVAAVGPHIEHCCFEVGEEVAAEIAAVTPLGEAVVRRDKPKPHVDLRRVIERQLQEVGVVAVDHIPGCTMCDPARFHSYRRDGKRGGRMLAVVVAGQADPHR